MKVKLIPETKPYSDWRGSLSSVISNLLEQAPILVKTNVWSNDCVMVQSLNIHGQYMDWYYINPIHLEDL
ncbi:MAG: hypothetical protein [Caudoviricetes sp.]|nr:MAG: hypothetical protein [Caudoviricetes sp.]